MRLFVAVGFDEGVKDAICSVRDRLNDNAVRGHVTLRDNLHLTLAFLGEHPPSGIPAIKSAMEKAAIPAFDIMLSGVGRFYRREGDLWWIGVKISRKLAELESRLRAELRSAGFALEEREFKPHLTIARGIALPDRFDSTSLDLLPIIQKTEVMHLMKSERINGELTYVPQISVRLN